MPKSEHQIQNEIRLALSEYGIVLRLNSGKFWQGRRVWSREFKQYVLTDLRPVQGCPEGTLDLLFIGDKNIAFIEVKDNKGRLRSEQQRFMDILKKFGHKVGVARSIDDALKIIEIKGR